MTREILNISMIRPFFRLWLHAELSCITWQQQIQWYDEPITKTKWFVKKIQTLMISICKRIIRYFQNDWMRKVYLNFFILRINTKYVTYSKNSRISWAFTFCCNSTNVFDPTTACQENRIIVAWLLLRLPCLAKN